MKLFLPLVVVVSLKKGQKSPKMGKKFKELWEKHVHEVTESTSTPRQHSHPGDTFPHRAAGGNWCTARLTCCPLSAGHLIASREDSWRLSSGRKKGKKKKTDQSSSHTSRPDLLFQISIPTQFCARYLMKKASLFTFKLFFPLKCLPPHVTHIHYAACQKFGDTKGWKMF